MAKQPSFVVGDTIKFSAEFRVNDVLTDPTAVALTIEEPNGDDQTPGVTNDGTGLRSGTFVPDQTGYHHWRWNSTGTAAGRKEGTIYVNSSAIT
jgi:hypothetical protein